MGNIKTSFGRKIKEYRKKKNLTQAQFAELVNVEDKLSQEELSLVHKYVRTFLLK